VKRRDVIKLRRSLYALTSPALGDMQVTNALHPLSYVSSFSALASYHLIPELTYAAASVTPRQELAQFV
jgi:hypothetical protein